MTSFQRIHIQDSKSRKDLTKLLKPVILNQAEIRLNEIDVIIIHKIKEHRWNMHKAYQIKLPPGENFSKMIF